jgi:hypothetical protein
MEKLDENLDQDDQEQGEPELNEDDQRATALLKIESLGKELTKTRDSAIEARTASGVEQDWLEDEEFYEGIDDANRDLYRRGSKPQSSEGGTNTKTDAKEVRSRVFLNITRPYVDAAAAKVADMLLPTDDQNWSIKETPIPTLVKHKDDQTPVIDPRNLKPMQTEEHGPDGTFVQRQMTVADQVKKILNQASEAAKAAETRINDWLAECNYNSETRKVIEYAGRLGTGIVKGPVPVQRSKRAVSNEGGLVSIAEEIVIGPESKAISPWNLYPDPNCGNNIHKGSFIWEKDKITVRNLSELRNDQSYIRENIERCLLDGPQKKYMDDKRTELSQIDLDDKDRFEIWYYYGFIGREEMESMGCECEEFEEIPAIITMVNDLPIKAAFNPNQSGCFPYDVMVWQARDDYWAGIGVARQIRTPQRMLNAAARQLMDNAGLSAGPQIVVDKSRIEPEDGNWKLAPRKVWVTLEEFDGPVAEAFQAINIPTMQAELMGIVQFAIKMAEDVTGLPMLLQGQQGKAPETVGGMQMLNNNASTVLRRIARTFDDSVTEPHIRRYYDWLLEDPDLPSYEKGDFKIIARGSSALVERDIQNQNIAQMGALIANPAFGINPKKWYAEHCRSQRLDPQAFQYTEDEQKALDEQMAQNRPPEIMIAEMKLAAEKEKAAMAANDREAEREFQLQLKAMEKDIAMLTLASTEKISLEKIKATLAGTAIKEKNKRDLQNQEVEVKKAQGSGI